MRDVDLVVIGAGFGGLAAALTAQRAGARVALLEALRYPGGCASTFARRGARFEAGATLFSGLAEGQLFGDWRRELSLDVDFDLLDEPISFRAPGLSLRVPADREALIDRLCALPGAPADGVRSFFSEQARVADTLWPIFADPTRLPPLSGAAAAWHIGRAWRYLPLLRTAGRPLVDAMARHGVADWAPLRSYLDALCQITVQTDAARAEAPFAMSAMDYCFRGTGHVRGGIGALAWALWRALERLGGYARTACRVKRLRRDGGAWIVEARGETLRAPRVVANLLPQALQRLLPAPSPRLAALAAPVASGWGAAMLYLTVREDAAQAACGGDDPHHLELVADPGAPFTEGNHVFCSISGAAEPERAPPGQRAVTVSTHVPMDALRSRAPAARGDYVAGVQAQMRATVRSLAPALAGGIVQEMTASPRTWERFTRRPEGLVGGAPRRAGWDNYRGLLPRPAAAGLYLAGDSVFPGQSTLAAALGGARTARAALSGRALWAA